MAPAERRVHAIAGRAAIDGADSRLVHRLQHRRRRVAQIDRGRRRRGAEAIAVALPTQIEAGAECPPLAGEDHDPDVAVLIGLGQQPRQIVQHRAGDRVHALRRIQRDHRDVVGDFVQHFVCGVGHDKCFPVPYLVGWAKARSAVPTIDPLRP